MQGPNLSSIVRHGLNDGPAEVNFHQKPVHQPSRHLRLDHPAAVNVDGHGAITRH